MKVINAFIFIFGFFVQGIAQTSSQDFFAQVDSLINAPNERPFNGKLLIAKENDVLLKTTKGFIDIPFKVNFSTESQFIIGSISKQFTAVLVLIEFEERRLDLNKPIKFYLPALSQPWADSVTSYHLLIHTHGIRNLDEPTAFSVGTQYEYSQIGYELLSQIVEKTSGKPFQQLSQELFDYCGMHNTTHPKSENYQNLSSAHYEDDSSRIVFDPDYLSSYVGAGGFISTPEDILAWNNQFYTGKLLKPKVMRLVTEKQERALRDHPLFGVTEYGCGISVDTKENILQYGQTGWSPGFVSMSFYFPETKLSVIAMMNVVYTPNDIVQTFDYLLKILKLVRASELVKPIPEPKHK